MIPETIVQIFRRKVYEKIRLSREGINRYIVSTPFMFDDGDHLLIILKQENGVWYLTDEGYTFMRVSYDEIDVEKATKDKTINAVLRFYNIKNVEGELRVYIENDDYGDALFSFIQGIIKITELNKKIDEEK